MMWWLLEVRVETILDFFEGGFGLHTSAKEARFQSPPERLGK